MFFRPNSSSNASSPARVFAIGDIHGCAVELAALIEKLKPTSRDTVVFLGDYIDRGPNSKGVIDIILELSARTHVIALRGNHEAMLLDFLEAPDEPGAGMFIINGGVATLASYGVANGNWEIPEDHLSFYKDLRLYWETDTHFFVHAGVPSAPLDSLNFEDAAIQAQMLWTRQPFLSTDYRWSKMVVHGHTPIKKLEKHANRINLDTGCVFGHSLTALELPANVFHSVARGAHAPDLPSFADAARISRRFSGQLPVRAGKPGAVPRVFETLNYNQYGLLMRDVRKSVGPAIVPGELIVGEIGTVDGAAPSGRGSDEVVKFVGHVVRTDTRGDFGIYAVRIEKIAGGVWGPDWIERPAS